MYFLRSKTVLKRLHSSAQVANAGPDTFARRYPSPTQWHFYGVGVTHQNTFTGDSVQHLSSVYCHLAQKKDAAKVDPAKVVILRCHHLKQLGSPHPSSHSLIFVVV